MEVQGGFQHTRLLHLLVLLPDKKKLHAVKNDAAIFRENVSRMSHTHIATATMAYNQEAFDLGCTRHCDAKTKS